ncbi:Cadherin-18 [Chelonia mydas]|uniref:Cadherin-18 n=1 Tax=Chelonia mydas TaxID=8469 RepID=M7CG43_CHEMY|nr:Cadherin-18 [Chelonia mydas]
MMVQELGLAAMEQRCYGAAHHGSIKVTRNQTKHIEGETEVHHRPKRGWVWNQFFVLEEHLGPDPQYVGKIRAKCMGPLSRIQQSSEVRELEHTCQEPELRASAPLGLKPRAPADRNRYLHCLVPAEHNVKLLENCNPLVSRDVVPAAFWSTGPGPGQSGSLLALTPVCAAATPEPLQEMEANYGYCGNWTFGVKSAKLTGHGSANLPSPLSSPLSSPPPPPHNKNQSNTVQFHEHASGFGRFLYPKLHSNSDKGDGSVKYILTGEGAGTIFIIDDTTGDIHSTKSLDREQKTHYVLHAQAIDRRTNKPLEPESEFIIKVQDINDNAPKFTDGPYIVTVPEMSEMAPSRFLGKGGFSQVPTCDPKDVFTKAAAQDLSPITCGLILHGWSSKLTLAIVSGY